MLWFSNPIGMTVKISRTRATVKDEAGCKQRGFCGFVCLSFQLLCQLKYHQLKNTEHSLRSNVVGGPFEQWSNKNKIQRDHTLGTLWNKSLSQNVSAGWLNKCWFQGKAITLQFIVKVHMHLCYHSELLWLSEKYYSVVIKWNVAQSLNIFRT